MIIVKVVCIVTHSVNGCFNTKVDTEVAGYSPGVVGCLNVALLPRTNITLNVTVGTVRLKPSNTVIHGVALFTMLVCRVINPFLAGVTLAGTKSVGRRNEGDTHRRLFAAGRTWLWGPSM